MFLADRGILQIDPKTDSFIVACPLLRHLILDTCYNRKQCELTSVDFSSDPIVWIPTILDHLDVNILTQKEAQKKVKDKQFPSEYILQSELFAIIRHVLRSSYLNWSVISEARTQGRADLYIQNHYRVVIELKSAHYYQTYEDLIPDLQQASRYGRSLKANTIVLLNISPWESATNFIPKSSYIVDDTFVHFINVSLSLNYGQDPKCRYTIQQAESILSDYLT